MVQLDAVRAIAIAAVMASHFFAGRLASEGARGVTLFFVLSGFLITGILLRCKTYVERDGQSPWLTMRQFYARRFLRIFPLYYLVLAGLWLLHDRGARTGLAWHLAYLSNIHHVVLGHRHGWPYYTVQHFWSLAVEEQFYLVWPCLVLLVPRRWLVGTVGALVCVGPLFRFAAAHAGWPLYARAPLPFYWFDALGLGALLAFAREPGFGLRPWLPRGTRAALVAGVAGIAVGLVLYRAGRGYSLAEAAYYFGYAAVSFWLVARAADGFAGAAGRVMSLKPLLWIGTISYGLYVYHPILVHAWDRLVAIHPIHVPRALAATAASIIVAAMSFYFYEKPINRLKARLPYRAKVTPKTTRLESASTDAAEVVLT